MTEQPEVSAPAEQPVCCVCGGGPVVYRNYREQPFCWPCADCQCAQNPCVRTGVNDPAVSAEPAEQPGRHTVDTITSDARRTSMRHLLDRADRGVLTTSEATLLRQQIHEELSIAAQARVDLDEMRAERDAHQRRAEAYGEAWQAAQRATERAAAARASTILQAQRWAARARTAETVLERLEARIDAVLEPQEPTP